MDFTGCTLCRMLEHVTRRSRSTVVAALVMLAGLVDAPPLSAARRHPTAAPRTVVLVRHAEKQVTQDKDPPLSEAGAARALELSRHLARAGVTHLWATEWRRTRETLAPLADATGLEVRALPATESAALLSALSRLPAGSVAVVAGHSDTIPALVRALVADGRPIPDLGSGDYDRLFVVTLWDKAPASVLELRY
jgi:phosphohistidine phosphatase SixA